jgi:hypothetical protein
MKPIAIWYHTRLEGGGINPDFATSLMSAQMAYLKETGLEAAASQINICTNGGVGNALLAAALAPEKAQIYDNGPDSESHLPTVCRLHEWIKTHPDWHVCYYHAKGVTHPEDEFNQHWRMCMESVVIGNWRSCVADLENGYDSAGAHWLTPEQFGSIVTHPFWGGMFFWATSNFLATLPPIPCKPTCRDDWFLSERWIGTGKNRPKVRDYKPHWPGLAVCYQR